MLLPEQNGDNQVPEDTGILDPVELVFFKAEPANISPFGASVLSWKVQAPQQTHFTLKLHIGLTLNATEVNKVGEQVVSPTDSTTYTLIAHAHKEYKILGSVVVTVITADCETLEPYPNVEGSLAAPVKTSLDMDTEVYLREYPVIRISPGVINLILSLKYRAPTPIPDPNVDIRARFGLSVVSGTVVATNIEVKSDINFPAWFTFSFNGLGLAAEVLIKVLDAGKEKAEKKTREGIEGLAELITGVATLMPPVEKRIWKVTIDVDDRDRGRLRIIKCPSDLLKRFASISEREPPVVQK